MRRACRAGDSAGRLTARRRRVRLQRADRSVTSRARSVTPRLGRGVQGVTRGLSQYIGPAPSSTLTWVPDPRCGAVALCGLDERDRPVATASTCCAWTAATMAIPSPRQGVDRGRRTAVTRALT